jgi:hypothetical protein
MYLVTVMCLDSYCSLFYHHFYKYVQRLTYSTIEATILYPDKIIKFLHLTTNCYVCCLN